jgi:hypothetical protein
MGFLAVGAILLSSVGAAGAAALPALKDGNWDTLKFVWDKPEAVPSETGCPIGNGHIGTRIRGGVGSETIRP